MTATAPIPARPSPRGIANAGGASCHTSAALQLLFHCFPALRGALLDLAPASADRCAHGHGGRKVDAKGGAEGGDDEIGNEFAYQLSWFFHLLAYGEDILEISREGAENASTAVGSDGDSVDLKPSFDAAEEFRDFMHRDSLAHPCATEEVAASEEAAPSLALSPKKKKKTPKSEKRRRLRGTGELNAAQRAAVHAFMDRARSGESSKDDWNRLVLVMRDGVREQYMGALGVVKVLHAREREGRGRGAGGEDDAKENDEAKVVANGNIEENDGDTGEGTGEETATLVIPNGSGMTSSNKGPEDILLSNGIRAIGNVYTSNSSKAEEDKDWRKAGLKVTGDNLGDKVAIGNNDGGLGDKGGDESGKAEKAAVAKGGVAIETALGDDDDSVGDEGRPSSFADEIEARARKGTDRKGGGNSGDKDREEDGGSAKLANTNDSDIAKADLGDSVGSDVGGEKQSSSFADEIAAKAGGKAIPPEDDKDGARALSFADKIDAAEAILSSGQDDDGHVPVFADEIAAKAKRSRGDDGVKRNVIPSVVVEDVSDEEECAEPLSDGNVVKATARADSSEGDNQLQSLQDQIDTFSRRNLEGIPGGRRTVDGGEPEAGSVDPTKFYAHLAARTDIVTDDVGDAAVAFRCIVGALELSVRRESHRLEGRCVREIEDQNGEGRDDNGKGTNEGRLRTALSTVEAAMRGEWGGTLVSRIVGTHATVKIEAVNAPEGDGEGDVAPATVTKTTTIRRTKRDGEIRRPLPVPFPLPVVRGPCDAARPGGDEGKPQSSESNNVDEEKGDGSTGRIYFTNLKEALGSVTVSPDPIRGYDWKGVIRREGKDKIVEETFVKKTDGDGNEILDEEEEKDEAENLIVDESAAIGDIQTKKLVGNESAEMGVGDSDVNDSLKDTPAPLNTYDDVSVITTASRSIACQTDFGYDMGTQMEFDEVGNIVHGENLKTIEIRIPGAREEDEEDVAKNEGTTKEEVKEEDAGEKNKDAGAPEEDAFDRRRRKNAIEKEACYAAAVTALRATPRRAPVGDVPSRLVLDGRSGGHSGVPSVGAGRRSLRVSADEKYQGRARGRRGTSVGSRRGASVSSSARGTSVSSSRRGASVSSRRSRHSVESTESPRRNNFDPSAPSRWAEAASVGGTPGSAPAVATATAAEDESIVSGITRMFSSMTADLAELVTPMGMVVGGDQLSSSAPPGAGQGWGPSPNAAPGWGPKREPEGPSPGSLALPSESSSDDESSIDSKVSSVDDSEEDDRDEGGRSREPSGRDLLGLNEEPNSPEKRDRGNKDRVVLGLDDEEISFSTRSSAIDTPSDIDNLSLGSFTDDSALDADEKKEDDDPPRKEEEKLLQSAFTSTTQENSDSNPSKATKREVSGQEAAKGVEDEALTPGAEDDKNAPKRSIEISPRGGSSASVFSAISDSGEDLSSSDESSSDGGTTSSSTSSTDSSSSSLSSEDDSSEDSLPFGSKGDDANGAEAAARALPVEGDGKSEEEVDGGGGFPAAPPRRPEWITRKETRLGHPLPSSLVFHLKRFEYSASNGRAEKLPGRVDAPEVLEVDAFCADLTEGGGCRYRLIGAVVHVDPMLEGDEEEETGGMTEGHYITLVRSLASTEGAGDSEKAKVDGCRGGGDTWMEIDDDIVRSLDPGGGGDDGTKDDVSERPCPALRAICGCDTSSDKGGGYRGRERRYATLVVYSRER